MNTLAQSSPLTVGYLASFLSAPFVLSGIGLRGFGTWALTGALAQYAGLLDFGVGLSLVRFIALYDAEERYDLISEVLASGILTTTMIAVTLGGLSLIVAAPVAHAVRSVSPGGMRILLLSTTCMLCTSNYTNVLFSHQIGLRRMVAPSMIQTVGVLINFAFSVGSALIFHSVVSYGMANAAASLISLALTFGYVRFVAEPRFRLTFPKLRTVRELTTFSFKSQMQTAAMLVNNQTDKIVIALFIGPAAAGAYELANRVAYAAQAVGIMSVSAMVPTLTADVAERSKAATQELYARWTQRSTALSSPILIVTAVLSPLILGAWLGKAPPNSGVVLCALALGYVLIATTGVGYTLAYALGAPGLPARAAVAAALANIVLTAALAPLFGIFGVLAGTAIAITGGALYQIRLVHREFEIPVSVYRRAVTPPLLISVTLALPIIAPSLLFAHSGRWIEAAVGCAAGGLYVIGYVLLAGRRDLFPEAVARRLRLVKAKV